jgi:integrase
VDRLAGVIRLADSKTGEGRVVPINPALGAIIARRWEARSTRRWDGRVLVSPWVFHGPLGGRLHEDQVYAAWYAACDRAGLPPPRVA